MASLRASKRRRLSPSDDESSPTPKSIGPSSSIKQNFYSRAAEWDLEQDYERRPRKGKKKDQEKTRLPIKTSEGVVHVNEAEDAANDANSFLDSDSENDNAEGGEEEKDEEEEKEEPAVPKLSLKAQIIQAKEEMAHIAMLINEDPEEHIKLFKRLADFVDKIETAVSIKKLALATQAAVFKDVIPGYRIRAIGEDGNKAEKLSKEVRQLRDFEQSLLSSYVHYVQQLTNLSKNSKHQKNKDEAGLRTVAIGCACNMLLAVPHFNLRTELIKILVNRLSKRRIDADFIKCRETMEEVFGKDNDGVVSLEAVGLLSKMMKARDFQVHESTLNTFLHLRLLSEFASKASRDRVDREEPETYNGKKLKNKKEFRTKRERKLEKDRKAVAKDMREADALVSNEARDRNQAETLKLVFGIYFRILKLRHSKLMGAVLEGLAKYAHLINQDFFGDLLEALKELIARLEIQDNIDSVTENAEENEGEDDNYEELSARQSTREVLLCTITAFALLEGQDASKAASSLHLDLSFFVTHLYRTLYPLSTNPDIEYNPEKSLRLPDPGKYRNGENDDRRKNKINFQTPMVLLLRCLQSTLLSRSHGTPPPARLASFMKRLMTAVLQLPEKSSIAMLALLSKVAKQHGRKVAPLWNTEERRGDGVFNPFANNVEQTNVFAGTIWEGELLRLHYCPEVRDAASDIDKLIATTVR
ncbi:nuclear export protein Noc3 [Talaromyces proteolyticus]|uniref:Nucleolar complex-associated protein 3 n=1 Tax=Talaromyces proteolyticus TaxID=1131652 RepID=A0AAD4Q6F3_9EURO|nr:nuclear export protein Noc3 [Talaromyces proteolyticus]KAH8705282.1 nuclear export protein Noc3 [Talaromyces proteolyticus]